MLAGHRGKQHFIDPTIFIRLITSATNSLILYYEIHMIVYASPFTRIISWRHQKTAFYEMKAVLFRHIPPQFY